MNYFGDDVAAVPLPTPFGVPDGVVAVPPCGVVPGVCVVPGRTVFGVGVAAAPVLRRRVVGVVPVPVPILFLPVFIGGTGVVGVGVRGVV